MPLEILALISANCPKPFLPHKHMSGKRVSVRMNGCLLELFVHWRAPRQLQFYLPPLFTIVHCCYLCFCVLKHTSVKKVHERAIACPYCPYFLVVRGLCEGSRTDFCGVGTGLWRGPCRHTLGWGTCSLFSHLVKDLPNKENISPYCYIPKSPNFQIIREKRGSFWNCFAIVLWKCLVMWCLLTLQTGGHKERWLSQWHT